MIELLKKKTLFKIKIIFFLISVNCFSQTDPEPDNRKSCPPYSVIDIFKKKDSKTKVKSSKKNFFLIFPIIGSQPATGFSYGAVSQYTFKGKKAIDKYSIVNLGVMYTTKQQLLINFKNNVLLNQNELFLSGDFRYYIFSQANYGLGTNIIPSKTSTDFDISDIAEPMNYNYIKFHQTFSKKITNNFYIGPGINLDFYSNIDDLYLNVGEGQYTYHYNYSLQYDYNTIEYSVTGLSLNLVYDSRDNQVNANHGLFANVNYRMNPSIFENQHASSVLYSELRYFLPLSKNRIQHVLGLWAYSQFLMGGRVPYLNLPAIGWDQRSRGGEGYTQGLFRGYDIAYLQLDYRFPITCNQLLTGVVFTNFTSTSNKDLNVGLFDYIQPAAGVGLRLLIDKPTRTNLVLDYAEGRYSKAFYLNAGETF